MVKVRYYSYGLLLLVLGVLVLFLQMNSDAKNQAPNQQGEKMTIYTVRKGGHFSFPRQSKSWQKMKKVVWNVRFQDNSCYLFPSVGGEIDRDQFDWNKLCGVYYYFWNTRRDAAMIGWRYNPEAETIELAPYYHVDSSRDMFKPIMSVSPGTFITLQLSIDHTNKTYSWTLNADGETVTHNFPFTHNRKRARVIQFYFGGNRTAPQNVSAEIDFKVLEVSK